MKMKFNLLIAAVILPIIYAWNEKYQAETITTPINRNFEFHCYSKQGLYAFNGNSYNHYHRDRTFTLKCRNIAQNEAENDCLHMYFWRWVLFRNYDNSYDKKLDFNCPDGRFIGGIDSVHHDRYEDREWKVSCCRNSEVKLIDCKKSDYVNNWQHSFNFELPENRFITGLESVHSNKHEDRKWRFYHCLSGVLPQTKVCDSKKAIMKWRGNFNKETLDRQWNFECSSRDIVDDIDNCYWSTMTNYFDLPLHYRCKSNYYISAIKSYGNTVFNDRAYKFQCCTGKDFKTYGCELTDDYINHFRDSINFSTNGKIILGIESYHDNTQEDRRWKLETCEYGRYIRKMECPSGHGIYKIRSSYDNKKHDRNWIYECRKVKSSFDYCYWTDYKDYTNGYFKTDCKVLNGMESLYNVNLKRRVWKFRCCSSKNLMLVQCTKTNDINGLKGEIDYEVGDNAIVTGLESQFHNDKNDAVWKVSTCRFIEPILSFDCGTNYGLSYIKSDFFYSYNDRLWTFRCTKVSEAGFENCHWLSKDFINKADMPMVANCPDHYVIVSGKSTHSNYHGDRKWNFQCCKPKGNSDITRNCVTTPYINKFQQHLEIASEVNHVITGLESYHNNDYEDRRWNATVCKFDL